MTSAPYDLIVVGLGAMGSAALFHAASTGAHVLGIDRYSPPHGLGSSHAESRITRLVVGEGAQYLPFAARSHEIWRALEVQAAADLLYLPGGYTICPPQPEHRDRWGDFVARTEQVADAAGLEFERRSAAEFTRHLPHVHLEGGESIGFEATGGVVLCERAIAVQLELARAAGAEIRTEVEVTDVRSSESNVEMVAGGELISARRAIVATGPWFRDLAPAPLGEQTTVTRQVVFWFEADEPDLYDAARFPFLIWAGDRAEDYLDVFPMIRGGVPGLKVLGEQFVESADPRSVQRTVSDDEVASFHERFVAPRLSGVTDRCVRAEVCLYTNTPDDDFLIDTDGTGNVMFASPCSGHGFKHSTAIAEAMVQRMTTGDSDLDLSPFAARGRPFDRT